MKRTPLLIALVAAVAVSAGCGARGTPIVRRDGRVGPFRIDVTTKVQILASEGKPDRVEADFVPNRKKPIGQTLFYRCGRGCETAYSINNATGALSDFETSSPRFVTERGSHVGMRAQEAARRERTTTWGPGCGPGPYLHVRWDLHHIFVLTAWRGNVDHIIYLGPHSVYYEGLC
jgi:hypothetical protein